jgi:hypothetical protein
MGVVFGAKSVGGLTMVPSTQLAVQTFVMVWFGVIGSTSTVSRQTPFSHTTQLRRPFI